MFDIPKAVASEVATASIPESAPRKFSKRPLYLFGITLMTMAYLMVELSFNARLLDVIGGVASLDEVKSIEHWGRLISGAAVTLVIWGMIVFPRTHKRRASWLATILIMLVTATFCFVIVDELEDRVVRHFVDNSTGEQRRIASHLVLLTRTVIEGKLKIAHVDISKDKPEGKTFVALLPFLAFSVKDVEALSIDELPRIIEQNIILNVGTAAESYNRDFIKSAQEIRNGYNSYKHGDDAYADALDSIPRRQDEAWAKYTHDLAKNHTTPEKLPQNYWPKARKAVREHGAPVPDDWEPSDRRGFNQAVAEGVVKQANAEFAAKTRNQVGVALPTGLSYAQFIETPAIQAKWRAGMQITDKNVRFSPSMTLDQYRAQIYQPSLNAHKQEIINKLLANPEQYEDRGPHGIEGRNAMTGLVVPPIALGFSIVGALTHIFKVLNFLAKIIGFGGAIRLTVLPVAVLALAGWGTHNENTITSSEAFVFFKAQMSERFEGAGPWLGWASERIIEGQMKFYPVNEHIRVKALGGYGFGYWGSGP